MKQQISPKGREQAIVIGSGIAGLVTARVLADFYERVTILERDHLPEGIENRKGVPQDRHPHHLLKRGQVILEQLFPGLLAQLVRDGAVTFNMGEATAWFSFGRWRPRFESKIVSTGCGRPFLETAVRRRLLACPGVSIQQDCEVIGLQADEAGMQVAGIRIRYRNGAESPTGETLLKADLVVDASGRDSKAPDWLAALGFTPPRETVVNSKQGYASRVYRCPPDWKEDWRLLSVRPEPPHHKRGTIFTPLEGGEQWLVALYGMAGDYPPQDEEGFMEFARSLATPKPYEILRQFTPVTPIVGNRRVENRMRHYNEMERYLENFLVTGDAAVAFNPMFAQGMSVAAMEALALGECLREQAQDEGLAARFQKRLAQLVAFPMQMASSLDLEWFPSENRVSDPEKVLMGRYIKQVTRAASSNPQVLEAFLHVQHLLEPPSTFFNPEIVLQVMNEIAAAS